MYFKFQVPDFINLFIFDNLNRSDWCNIANNLQNLPLWSLALRSLKCWENMQIG